MNSIAGNHGRLYKASIGGKVVPKTGNRNGTITSDAEMEKAKNPTVKKSSTAPKVDPHFTGQTVGTDGVTYYFVDGKPAKGPEEVAAAQSQAEPEEVLPEDWTKDRHELTRDKHAAIHITASDDGDGFDVATPDGNKHFPTYEAAREFADAEHERHVKEALTNGKNVPEAVRYPEITHENELAGASGSGTGGRLHPERELGGDAATAPGPMLPGSGEGSGGRPGSVPSGDDERRDGLGEPAGGPGTPTDMANELAMDQLLQKPPDEQDSPTQTDWEGATDSAERATMQALLSAPSAQTPTPGKSN